MLKKKSISLIIAAVLFITAFSPSLAQEGTNSACVKKGNIAIDAYYGFPNMMVEFVRSAFQQESYLKHYHFKNIGPVGIHGEYFIFDHIAMGIDANYSLTHILWEEKYEYTDGLGNTVRTLNYCDYSVARYRLLAKFNYHYSTNKHFDWYVGGGFGFNKTEENFKSDKPGYFYTPENIPLFTQVPISARVNFGGKFYFAKNIGVGFEFGLFGGSPFLASVCTKF